MGGCASFPRPRATRTAPTSSRRCWLLRRTHLRLSLLSPPAHTAHVGLLVMLLRGLLPPPPVVWG